MASPAQIAANRENSARSTGPVTASGKAASSQNAFRHGLTSARIVLPGEDPAEYDKLRESLLRQYIPANEVERTLVEELAAASWRLFRARRFETAVLAKILEGAPDPDAAFATTFLEKPKDVDRLLRYVTAHERAMYRALQKLEKLQKERAAEEQSRALEETWVAQVKSAGVGFVSQSLAAPGADAVPRIEEPRRAAGTAEIGLPSGTAQKQGS
jgi:hypothetical protein